MKKLKNVLLIEDDDIVNFYNEFLLKNKDFTENIAIARNGLQGIEYIKKARAGAEGHHIPDLIFLDINMPIMNGFEFLEEYEKLEIKSVEKVLVVMLTSSMHPKDQEKAQSFRSVSEYMYKPLQEENIGSILEKYF